MTTTTPQTRPLMVPSDLSEEACTKVGDALLPLTADAIALYIKVKNYHWHMTGSHFKEYHELLDEHADQVFAMVDVLAERARKLGQATVHSVAQVAAITRIKDDQRDFVDPRGMFAALLADNKEFNAAMRAAHDVVDDARDVATASLLENFIDETERRIWFLYETVTGLD
jgi:starvation-inducible DNA-binding protein